MAFNYLGDPSVSDVAAVRFEIQDTNANAPLLQDEEISFAILRETAVTPSTAGVSLTDGQIYLAAARCMETLVRLFSAQADQSIGSLKVTYKDQAQNYADRGKELRLKAQGLNAPYAGGQSVSEKHGFRANTDLPGPLFSRDQYSNPWTGSKDANSFDSEDFGPPVG